MGERSKYDDPLGLTVPIYYSIFILLLSIISKKVLYFCVPIIVITFLCFLFYACIIRPLKSKDKVKELGYMQCMIKWLLDAMLYKYIYLKVVALCCITSIILERFILQLFIDAIFGVLAFIIIGNILLQIYCIIRVLLGKPPFIFEYENLPSISKKIISMLSKKCYEHPLDPIIQNHDDKKDSSN